MVARIYRPKDRRSRTSKVPEAHAPDLGRTEESAQRRYDRGHHNPYDAAVFEDNFPVRVVKRFGWAHSLRVQSGPGGMPSADTQELALHRTPGRSDGRRAAATKFFGWTTAGALDHRTVIVHGVALTGKGLKLAEKRWGIVDLVSQFKSFSPRADCGTSACSTVEFRGTGQQFAHAGRRFVDEMPRGAAPGRAPSSAW